MSTVFFESFTRTSSSSPSSSQSHSINSSSSSLQTPPPTPRRTSEGPVAAATSTSSSGTRHYPRHLNFPIPRRLINSSTNDVQGTGTCTMMSMEDKLVEFSSDFAGVPVDYVRLSIRKRGEKLYDVIKSSTFRLNGPDDIQISQGDLGLEPGIIQPSHVLAVYPLSPSSSSIPDLHGIHSIIPTIYCANFPSFPKSDNSSTLPRLPIRLPHPPSFKIILHFLYTRNIQNILSYLLPVPGSSRRRDHISHPIALPSPISLSSLASWVRDLFNSLSFEDRCQHLNLLYGVYLNIVALGMYDLPLQGSRDEDSVTGNGKKNNNIDIVHPNLLEYGSIVLQNGSRDVDGRLLCLCLIAMWEALWKN
ncbi:hypothetical protein Clacol_007130 [Clathrus columnatus]|uniref:Ubiquitin-like domain-containing protein n=1 Tax=Clathrus columnatus TaxID=1419009 RepID=A0AAV5AE35_9AGAM|nr:hypothetical protein Clacol_007130 [Clathrus columnatus]